MQLNESDPIGIRSQTKHDAPRNTLMVVDPNISHRRHSMDTSQLLPAHSSGSTVVKSQSTIMSAIPNESLMPSDQLNLPTIQRKKSVSSKERLFSVESIHRTSSTKSVERLLKVATTVQPSSSDSRAHHSLSNQDSGKDEERTPASLSRQPSLTVTTADNVRH